MLQSGGTPMADRHQPAKSLLFAEFCKNFPVLRRNLGETGSHMTAHTTIFFNA
jgi:hypothetical protein